MWDGTKFSSYLILQLLIRCMASSGTLYQNEPLSVLSS